MKRKIREFIWNIFGRPECPPKDIDLKSKINPYTKKQYEPRYYSMVKMYINNNLSLEEIAKKHNVTRERVRQCLWKAYRDNT